MRHVKLNIFLLLLLLISGRDIFPQDNIDTVSTLPGIEIQTSVDRAEIYIGDLITYKIAIVYDSTYELVPPPLGANLGAFDVKDYQSDIITSLPDGRIQSEGIFVLSTFTTGDYVIPPIPVLFNLPDGTKKVMLSEGVPIKVKSLLLNTDDSLDIKPLKAQYEFPRDLTAYYLWGGLVLLALIIIGLIIWSKFFKKKEILEPVDLRPAWEIAFEKLAILKQNNLLENQKYKQFYIELTEIARTYLEKMFQLNVTDMTTEEFLDAFKSIDLPDNLYERMNNFLRHADLVKFAKYIPERERTETDFEDIYSMIEQVRLDFERRQRPEVHVTVKDENKEKSAKQPDEVAP